ncbi:MAG: 2-oxoacid ferredoxin oxidoreductase [Candidatus Eisenbacteria bacterium]|nr:2-oxoacid ferredoxin oxidoreductase [Candidatus Eisenbacteria bacterium]
MNASGDRRDPEVRLEDFGDFETAWCPGCGNFGILAAVKRALVELQIAPHQLLFVSGIGQAAKSPHYLRANLFNGLHGRALPVATGAKLANPELVVLVQSGDGCSYGEGGNHFLAAIRRNIDLTLLAHDNRVYGLTKGQASPTSPRQMQTKAQPGGPTSEAFDPLAVAVTMHASFVARGFAGRQAHLAGLIAAAVRHRGFALVDILQPCVSYNRIHTHRWYEERCYELDGSHDPTDRDAARARIESNQERIPLGILYRNERPVLRERFPALQSGPLVGRSVDRAALAEIVAGF